MKIPFWSTFAFALVAIFSLPIFSLFITSIEDNTNVWSHLSTTVLPVYLENTILLMLGVGLGTFIIGVGTGLLIAFYEFPGRKWIEWALVLPLAMPAYILAFVYFELMEYSGPLQTNLRMGFGWNNPSEYWFPEIASLGGAIVILSLVLYPYVYLLSRNAFQQIPQVLTEASRMLGDKNRYGFWKIVIPMARPAIIVGLSLALMETLADFGTVQLFSVQTFTTGIYHTWFGNSNPSGAAQLGLSLLFFIALLLALERFSRRKQRYHVIGASLRRQPRTILRGLSGATSVFLCLLPVVLGFALPAFLLVQLSLVAIPNWEGERFFSDAASSITLAGITSISALTVGLLLNFGSRLSKKKILRMSSQLVSLGYAFPGPVIALGVLLPLSWFDKQLNQILNSGGYYLLSGTVFILIYAYLIRFLALAKGTLESGFANINPVMEDSGRLLGSPPVKILRDLHLPMLRGSLWTASLLVFVDVMKELPATLMLQPFNFNTLATRTFAYASDEMLEEAAPWCLAIVMIGLLPVILLNRKLRSSQKPHETSHRLMPIVE